jgi:hypothetical protein
MITTLMNNRDGKKARINHPTANCTISDEQKLIGDTHCEHCRQLIKDMSSW